LFASLAGSCDLSVHPTSSYGHSKQNSLRVASLNLKPLSDFAPFGAL